LDFVDAVVASACASVSFARMLLGQNKLIIRRPQLRFVQLLNQRKSRGNLLRTARRTLQPFRQFKTFWRAASPIQLGRLFQRHRKLNSYFSGCAAKASPQCPYQI
jgi:hypothetical protein